MLNSKMKKLKHSVLKHILVPTYTNAQRLILDHTDRCNRSDCSRNFILPCKKTRHATHKRAPAATEQSQIHYPASRSHRKPSCEMVNRLQSFQSDSHSSNLNYYQMLNWGTNIQNPAVQLSSTLSILPNRKKLHKFYNDIEQGATSVTFTAIHNCQPVNNIQNMTHPRSTFNQSKTLS